MTVVFVLLIIAPFAAFLVGGAVAAFAWGREVEDIVARRKQEPRE